MGSSTLLCRLHTSNMIEGCVEPKLRSRLHGDAKSVEKSESESIGQAPAICSHNIKLSKDFYLYYSSLAHW